MVTKLVYHLLNGFFFSCVICSFILFTQVYPDPVRVVAVGRKVEDLLADPKNEEWSSISTEFCGG